MRKVIRIVAVMLLLLKLLKQLSLLLGTNDLLQFFLLVKCVFVGLVIPIADCSTLLCLNSC